MGLRHVATRLAGPDGYLTGLSDLLVRATAQGDRLYTVSAAGSTSGGGVMVLDPRNGLALLDQAAFPSGSAGLDAPRQLEFAMVGGAPALLSVGQFGTRVDLFALDAAGLITTPRSLSQTGGETGGGLVPGAVEAVETVTLGARSFIVLASRQESGLTVWEAAANNRLTLVGRAGGADLLPADGVAAMATVTLGGQSLLLVLSSGDKGLQAYRMEADGTLALTTRLDARDGLAISDPTTLEVVSVAGQSYALIGAAGSGSLAVVALAPDGRMTLTDHVIDDLTTRFAGLSEMASLTVDGQVYIAVAGSDDGVTLMTLLPGGRLVQLATIEDDNAMALTNPSGLALSWSQGRLDIFVAGGVPAGTNAAGSGITQLAADLGAVGMTLQLGPGGVTQAGSAGRDQIIGGAGNDRITGGGGEDILVDGAGSDTLTGGAGADVFVLTADGAADRIADFERGSDRLDLADLGRFYSLDALDFTPTASGAEIRIGAERVIIDTADGRPLTLADLQIGDLRDLSHLIVAPLSETASLLQGDAGANFLDGRGGGDTLAGGSGADTLIGNGGDDWLMGGTGYPGFDAMAGTVFRLYQATLGRAPDMAGLVSWTNSLFTEARSPVQVAAGFVGSAEFRKAYAGLDTAGFVTLLYANVLGRAPDAAGLASWTGLLDSGARSREQVVLGFSDSTEFRQTTAASALAFSREGVQMSFSDDVFRLYQATLDRDPDLAGFLSWTGKLAGGLSFGTVISGFVNSAEFRATYGQTSDRDFVTLLYANVLGRAPDPAGLNSWLTQLSAGTRSREQVVEGFVQSREFIAATADPLRDWMGGLGPDDRLDGGSGGNLLFGGMLSDSFVFNADAPSLNRVIGFEAWDVLSFQGFGYDDPTDLAGLLRQEGQNVIFADQGVTVVFERSTLAAVLDADFLF